MSVGERCHVFQCTNLVVAKGLCAKHYKRQQRHGHVEDTRATDWGDRAKHPAYPTWKSLRRFHRSDIPEEWVEDFWAFANAVPEFPEGGTWTRLFRKDSSKGWNRDNLYWRVSTRTEEERKSHRDYMRRRSREWRAANPEYFRDKDLRKNYGVSLEWYQKTFEAQNGVCAICGEPETAVIHGKTVSLAVDHCHDTGKVRGLLCAKCNHAIGGLRHDPKLLERALEYLRRHSDF